MTKAKVKKMEEDRKKAFKEANPIPGVENKKVEGPIKVTPKNK